MGGKFHLSIHFSGTTSAKAGEICELRINDIDHDNGAVHLGFTLERISKEAYEHIYHREIYSVYPDKVADSPSLLVLKKPKTAES